MAARVARRYVRAFAPEKIILFGSYAKVSNRPTSDMDLLVIAEVHGDPALQLRRARQLAADSFPPIDVVMATPEEAAMAESSQSPFLFSVLELGVVVYRRPWSNAVPAQESGRSLPQEIGAAGPSRS
jgi:predicted nucleotidyltransferase